MANTLAEALAQTQTFTPDYADENSYFVINNDLRTISVPAGFFFGVYNDKDVHIANFFMPRKYGKVDLGEFNIRINYTNAANESYVYDVTDISKTETVIAFKWILGRNVFAAAGIVRFIVCLRLLDGEGALLKEFNTTIVSGNVLDGLEVE